MLTESVHSISIQYKLTFDVDKSKCMTYVKKSYNINFCVLNASSVKINNLGASKRTCYQLFNL